MPVVFVDAIGVVAPGIESWEQGRSCLNGSVAYSHEDVPRYKPQLLPPNERRRATGLVRLAFNAAEQAIEGESEGASEFGSVFASSGGDYSIVHQICEELCTPRKLISPSQFHNSVHNSAAGYWSIATSAHAASISLSAYDWSFSTGLLEAVLLLGESGGKVLYVCYDDAPAEPLVAKRTIRDPFAVALVLSAGRSSRSLFELDVAPAITSETQSCCDDPAFEQMRLGNPAARSLPMLALFAAHSAGRVYLPVSPTGTRAVDVSPLSAGEP